MVPISNKRLRLDPSASPPPSSSPKGMNRQTEDGGVVDEAVAADLERGDEREGAPLGSDDEDGDHCVICLHTIRDRTILPCAHDRLCFDCIFVWCQQSRKCPLCNAPIGPYLIHHFRSEFDYSKYYLQSPRAESPTGNTPALTARRGSGRTRVQTIRWGPRRRNVSRSRERQDDLEIAISRRRWIYRNKLFAKHVASNPYTRYRAAPTPAQISASPDLISRATIFVRRELRVWINLDVEFLTTFILSLMKSLDLRSESAVKLLAEFLDMDIRYFVGEPEDGSTGRFANAEHFAHELYSYLRSPFKELAAYDSAVQYDTPSDVPPAPQPDHERRRWDTHVPPKHKPSTQRGRGHSPSSPIYRSPRDAFSRSPSPANSDDYDGFYRHSTSAQQSRNINYENSRPANTRDVKGKGRSSSRSISGARGPRCDDRHTRITHRNVRTVSPRRRSPVPPLERHLTTNSPHSDEARYSPRQGHIRGSDARASDPSPPLALVTFTGARGDAPGDLPVEYGLDNAETSKPANHQAENIAWGISIKGQAKLLLGREVTQKISDSHQAEGPVKNSVNNVVPKKRPRDPSDLLHAHLGHNNSGIRAQKIAGSSGAIMDNSEDISQELDNKNGKSSYQKRPDRISPPRTSSGISAQDIMARTRVKLAKLRTESTQTPLVDVVPGKLSDISTETQSEAVSSTIDLRTRLMERLDEEKRRAVEGSVSWHVGDVSSEHPINLPHAEKPFLTSENGNDVINAVPSTHQVEKKLRTQALLRMRLAAEKKKIDVLPVNQGSDA